MDDTKGLTEGIAADCRFFLGDRPCVWHKREGAVCQCERYQPIGDRLLLIKLDAMGDVLRTTALLPGLAQKYPGFSISWLTRVESVPLLERNPFITEVLTYGPDCLVHLATRQFHTVINLDAGRLSAGLATMARAKTKVGFSLHERGYVEASNQAAAEWLRMGIDDTLKRQGTRTYQSRMADILGLPSAPTQYVFDLAPSELEAGRASLASLGLDLNKPILGLNTGAGGRWPLKQWRLDGYIDLISNLSRDIPQFVLLGGPSEESRNEAIRKAAPVHVFDAGCQNPIRHFASMLAQCAVVVTGDTLAMHLSVALKRQTVVLFGPTSAPEIELYECGEKVMPRMECLGCYKTSCDFVPNCMDLISTEMVAAAVRRQLDVALASSSRK